MEMAEYLKTNSKKNSRLHLKQSLEDIHNLTYLNNYRGSLYLVSKSGS